MLVGRGQAAHLGAVEDVVSVSGQTIYSLQDDPDDAYAGLKIDNNGNVYEYEGTSATPSWSQIDSSADWVRPATSVPGLYEVRYTAVSGPSLWSETAAVNVWHDLSGGDYILMQRETTADSANNSLVTIEIRYNGGSVLDSANYRLWAEVLGIGE